MPDRLQSRVFGFTGGFATDLPTQARELNYWLNAENVIFEVSGAARKLGGASKINSTAIASAPDLTGIFDFWRGGGAATFTQKFVAMTSNSKIYKDDMDGIFDDITGAATITADAIPVFCQARDLLIIADDKNDTPLKWNQTGDVATLGGSPPAGRGFVFHANRPWTWGANANASRLTYGSSTSAEDYTGADTGSIDIEPDDGDRIIGVVSHKEILFVLKGPNKGSIHMILGTAPTGGDAFSRKVLVRGIALQTHNSIVPIGDDILFMSERAIHSLAATQQFGNFEEADVTRYLKGYFRNTVHRLYLDKVWGVNYADKSMVIWQVPTQGATENTAVLGLSYVRLKEEGWKPLTWTRAGTSATVRINPTTRARELVFGTTEGFAALQDTASRSIYDTTAYSLRMRSPQVIIAQEDQVGKPRGDQPVQIERFYMRSESLGNYDLNTSLSRLTVEGDIQTESYTFNQGEFGFDLDISFLDIDSLGGDQVQVVYSDPEVVGEARAVQFDITQGGLNQDANLLEFGVDYKPTGQTSMA